MEAYIRELEKEGEKLDLGTAFLIIMEQNDNKIFKVETFTEGLLFFTLFDQFLNVRIGKSLFYLGTTAMLDRFFKKRLWLYVSLKVIAFLWLRG